MPLCSPGKEQLCPFYQFKFEKLIEQTETSTCTASCNDHQTAVDLKRQTDFSMMMSETTERAGKILGGKCVEATLNKWGFPTPMNLKHTFIIKGSINKTE